MYDPGPGFLIFCLIFRFVIVNLPKILKKHNPIVKAYFDVNSGRGVALKAATAAGAVFESASDFT